MLPPGKYIALPILLFVFKSVTVYPQPCNTLTHTATIVSSANPVCTGSPVTLTAHTVNSGPSPEYMWIKNGSTVGRNVATYTDNSPQNDDNYYCIVTGENCLESPVVVSNSIKMIVMSRPEHFLPDDTAICSYDEMMVKPLTNFKTYNWSNGSGASAVTIKNPGKYWCEVSDHNNCSGRDTLLINPKQCLQGFLAPNSFTPNHDGKNDSFRPLLFGIVKKYQLIIYNRWGNIVFQTKDHQKGWDGSFSGKDQNSNSFIWQCSYELQGEPAQIRKGSLLLLR